MNYKEKYLSENDKNKYNYLYHLPPKKGRYLVLDTETTGLEEEDHIIDVGLSEIIDGRISCEQFQVKIRPRKQIEENARKRHGISNESFDEYFFGYFIDERNGLSKLLHLIGNSIIFSHQALFHSNFLNKELIYWGLPTIPKNQFRCSLRIFRTLIKEHNPHYNLQNISLKDCCIYYGIPIIEENLHTTTYDSFINAQLILKLFENK